MSSTPDRPTDEQYAAAAAAEAANLTRIRGLSQAEAVAEAVAEVGDVIGGAIADSWHGEAEIRIGLEEGFGMDSDYVDEALALLRVAFPDSALAKGEDEGATA